MSDRSGGKFYLKISGLTQINLGPTYVGPFWPSSLHSGQEDGQVLNISVGLCWVWRAQAYLRELWELLGKSWEVMSDRYLGKFYT